MSVEELRHTVKQLENQRQRETERFQKQDGTPYPTDDRQFLLMLAQELITWLHHIREAADLSIYVIEQKFFPERQTISQSDGRP